MSKKYEDINQEIEYVKSYKQFVLEGMSFTIPLFIVGALLAQWQWPLRNADGNGFLFAIGTTSAIFSVAVWIVFIIQIIFNQIPNKVKNLEKDKKSAEKEYFLRQKLENSLNNSLENNQFLIKNGKPNDVSVVFMIDDGVVVYQSKMNRISAVKILTNGQEDENCHFSEYMLNLLKIKVSMVLDKQELEPEDTFLLDVKDSLKKIDEKELRKNKNNLLKNNV